MRAQNRLERLVPGRVHDPRGDGGVDVLADDDVAAADLAEAADDFLDAGVFPGDGQPRLGPGLHHPHRFHRGHFRRTEHWRWRGLGRGLRSREPQHGGPWREGEGGAEGEAHRTHLMLHPVGRHLVKVQDDPDDVGLVLANPHIADAGPVDAIVHRLGARSQAGAVEIEDQPQRVGQCHLLDRHLPGDADDKIGAAGGVEEADRGDLAIATRWGGRGGSRGDQQDRHQGETGEHSHRKSSSCLRSVSISRRVTPKSSMVNQTSWMPTSATYIRPRRWPALTEWRRPLTRSRRTATDCDGLSFM